MQRHGINTLEIANFIGYNIADDSTSLPPGYLIAGSRDIDLTRQLGAMSKRLGMDGCIATSLGNQKIKGISTYRHSGGDKIMFGWSTSYYKLEGTSSTLTKTTNADFNAGTLDDVRVTSNAVYLDPGEIDVAIAGGGFAYETLSVAVPWGQTFTTGAGVTQIVAMHFYLGSITNAWGTGENITLTLYDTPAKGVNMGSVAVNGPQSYSTWVYFIFSSPIVVVPATQYYLELTISSGSTTIDYRSADEYAGGAAYKNGVIQSGDIGMQVYKGWDDSGTWTSPTYDLALTPSSASLSWNITTPANTSVEFYARGSSDDSNWSDWQRVVTSTNGIPKARYVEVKFILATSDNVSTPNVADFTITYASGFNTATAIKTSLSGNKVSAIDYEGDHYYTEGGTPQRYDGTTNGNIGITPPASAPTLATGGAGNPNGAYYCKVTFVNSYGAESNGGTTSAVVNPVNQQISWSVIPVGAASTWISQRKLYRTKAGGSVYYYVATIADNTTTTYTDNTADSALVTELETDNTVPSASNIIYEHKNYFMYVANSNPRSLYFSKVGIPESVPTTQYKSFSSSILGVRTYSNALVVGGKNFTSVVFGNIWGGGSDDTDIRRISTTIGPVSQDAMCECFSPTLGNVLVIVTDAGVHYLTPDFQEESLKSVPLSREVQAIFDNAIDRTDIATWYNSNKLFIALKTTLSGVITNVKMVYNFVTSKWNPPAYQALSGFAEANSKLYGGSAEIGQIYELETGSSDDGDLIHSTPQLSPMYPGGMGTKVRLIDAAISVASGSDTGALEMKPKMDGVQGVVAVGSTTTWNDGLQSPFKRLPVPRGYRVDFSFDDNSDNDWTIEKLTLRYERGA